MELSIQLDGAVVVDMPCYLRLHAELSLCAKGMLMMRKDGFVPSRDPEIPAKLVELDYLDRSIGRTGMAAIAPVLHGSSPELWQLRLLECT